jgi:hypothetical protein
MPVIELIMSLTKRLNQRLDLRLFDSLSVALFFNQGKNGLHDAIVSLHKQITLPAHQVQRVDVIDVLLSLVHLPLDPMAVKIPEQMVVVLRGGRVSLPLLDVELK